MQYIKLYRSPDTVVAASLTLDNQQANQSVKSFRTELKSAQADLITMTGKFGDTSKEAVNAAKRVAELRDRIGDANSLVNAFNPDRKFAALGQAVQGVVGGFAALQGVMGLLGVQSDGVQKQLLKVQSALALTQGLDNIRESVQGFKNLAAVISTHVVQAFSTMKGAIIASGIGALAVGLTVLIVKLTETTAAQRAFDAATKESESAVAGFTSKLKEVESTMNLARRGVVDKKEALKLYNEKLGDSIGFATSFEEAENNIVKNTKNYVEALRLRTRATVLFRIAAEEDAKVLSGEAGKLSFWQKIEAG